MSTVVFGFTDLVKRVIQFKTARSGSYWDPDVHVPASAAHAPKLTLTDIELREMLPKRDLMPVAAGTILTREDLWAITILLRSEAAARAGPISDLLSRVQDYAYTNVVAELSWIVDPSLKSVDLRTIGWQGDTELLTALLRAARLQAASRRLADLSGLYGSLDLGPD
jgi:hypothetical protein